MTVSCERFDVADMLDQVVAAAEGLLVKKNNRLVRDTQPDLGMMLSDDLKIRQCLLNLLSNAAKSSPKADRSRSPASRSQRDGADWLQFGRPRHRDRHDRGADRPPVPPLLPGR